LAGVTTMKTRRGDRRMERLRRPEADCWLKIIDEGTRRYRPSFRIVSSWGDFRLHLDCVSSKIELARTNRLGDGGRGVTGEVRRTQVILDLDFRIHLAKIRYFLAGYTEDSLHHGPRISSVIRLGGRSILTRS
jgi:hypothetical protein